MRTTIRTTALALSLVALAACADAGDPTTAATTPVTTAGTTGATDDTTGATVDPAEASAVDIDDFRFVPETITVAAGTEVTWTNRDDTAHTVTAGSEDDPRPDEFDLEVAAAGDTVTTTFDEPGTYDYFCELHPFMVGTVEVTG